MDESAKYLAESFFPRDDISLDSDIHKEIRAKLNNHNNEEQDTVIDPPSHCTN